MQKPFDIRKNSRIYRMYIWGGSFFFILGSIFMIYFGSRDYIVSPLFFISGTVLYGAGFAPYMRLDEEAIKIGNKAAAFAWKLTLFLVSIILCIRMMFVVLFSIDIGGYQLLGCSILSMVLAMLIANEYYLRKGVHSRFPA